MVEYLCPECAGPLEAIDERTARCTLAYAHRYEILLARRPFPMGELPHPILGETESTPSAGRGKVIPEHLQGLNCENHPDVQAARRCRGCQKLICPTCLFEFPGRVYLCPECATKPQEDFTPKRRGYLVWSCICAGLGTLLFVSMFAAFLLPGGGEAVATLAFFGVLVSAVVGIGLAGAARPPGKSRPAIVQVAWWWNLALLGCLLLLTLVGILMGG